MRVKITQRCETSTGRSAFRFSEGEEIDTEASDKLSLHPDARKRVKLKSAAFDAAAQRLVDLGLAERV